MFTDSDKIVKNTVVKNPCSRCSINIKFVVSVHGIEPLRGIDPDKY